MKRALLVGINYTGTESELNGCINDITNVSSMLRRYGYTEIIMLRDDDHAHLPEKNRIMSELKNIIGSMKKGDSFYFHYSGHGSYVVDRNRDEVDKRDECICPLDYPSSGFITDDELHDTIFVPTLPKCKIRIVFDSCHSGSAIDAPLRWSGYKLYKENNVTPIDSNGNVVDCVFISGCRDEQTSADAFIAGKYSGAITYAWLNTLNDAGIANYNWQDIIAGCQLWLKKNGYDQIPQLGVCEKKKLKAKFDL